MDNEIILLILWILLGVLSLSLMVLIAILVIKSKKNSVQELELINNNEPLEPSVPISEPLAEEAMSLNSDGAKEVEFLPKEEPLNNNINNNNRNNDMMGIDNFVNKTPKEIAAEIKKAKKEEKQRRKEEKKLKKYVPMDMNLENTSKTFGDIKVRSSDDRTLLNPIVKDIQRPDENQQQESKTTENNEEIEIIDI